MIWIEVLVDDDLDNVVAELVDEKVTLFLCHLVLDEEAYLRQHVQDLVAERG